MADDDYTRQAMHRERIAAQESIARERMRTAEAIAQDRGSRSVNRRRKLTPPGPRIGAQF